MKNMAKTSLFALGVAALVLALGSCATTNRLGDYRFEGSTLATGMRVPPQPTFGVGYSVRIDAKDPIGTWFSVGTNLAKADQAQKAEDKMMEALGKVDVPDIVLEETTDACAFALGAQKTTFNSLADFLLSLEIREYGLSAPSWSSSVTLRMHMTASLYHNVSGEVIWRRDINVDRPASPEMFGGGEIVGNLVTAFVLSELTVEQLERGFEQLARDSARSVARALEDDLYSARYGNR